MNKLITILSIVFLISCNAKQQKTISSTPEKKIFPMIEIPAIITEPTQRADYLAQHYWDKFNFTDTSYISPPEITEQALANYINVLTMIPAQQASSALKGMMAKAEADSAMFAHFCNLYDKYLYDPNSPMRNEELYIPVLEAIVTSGNVDEVEKIRPEHRLNLALRNRPGHQATNITYTLASGATGNLNSVKSEYIILFFYNPDCHNCQEIRESLTASTIITNLQKTNQLKVVAIYPDEDITAWKKYIPNVPKEWINAYDENLVIRDKEIYDLKAIPTLYLLDKNKKILLKDTTFPILEDYLEQNVKE